MYIIKNWVSRLMNFYKSAKTNHMKGKMSRAVNLQFTEE